MKKKKWEPFIAVIHPVYLKSGLSTEILADFAKYYPAYAKSSSKAAKAEIIAKLVSKYKDDLGEDFFPKPVAVKKTSARKAPAKKKNEISSLQKKDEIVPSADIDFIFHRMFVRVLKLRGRGELMEKASLVSDSWLFDLKNKQQEARDNDLLSRQNEISGEIAAKMTDLSRLLEKSRKLGSISIVFSTNRIEKERQKILSSIIIPFIGPVKGTHFVLALFFVMALAFIVVLHFMVKNLKKLEKWALEVGEGNLGKRIEITSRDEIGRLGDVFNRMIDEIIQKYHLEKFVSKSTKSMIARHGANGAKIDLGVNQRKNMAFIFSDVRGFTSFSENNDPETVINVLNTYLELQSCIVKENRGDIDDYVGDQIMAHFSGERRADAAIETALKIMRAIRRTNESRKAQGLPVFEVGIGVHGGEVVTGNVGSEFRMDFTCVGDAVNLTSRLCSNAAADEILVSQELFLQATKKHAHEIIAPLAVKGKREPIPVVRLKV